MQMSTACLPACRLCTFCHPRQLGHMSSLLHANGNPSKSLFSLNFRRFLWYKRERYLHLHHVFFLTLHYLLSIASRFDEQSFQVVWELLKCLCLCFFLHCLLIQIMQHKIKLPKCNTTPANVTRWGVFWSRLGFPPPPFLPQPQSPSPLRLLLPSAGSSDIDKSFQETSGDVRAKAERGWRAHSDARPVCLYLFDVPLKVPYDAEFTLPMFSNNSLSPSANSQEMR